MIGRIELRRWDPWMVSIMQADGKPDAAAELPDFVQARIERHTVGRIQRRWGGQHILRGLQPPQDAIHLSSNDYLCLLGVAELKAAQLGALNDSHRQLLMSAVFAHGDTATARLEKKFAQFMGAEDAIICQSGWAANVGLLQTLAGPDVPVYLDMNAHMSLWQGAYAARAKAVAFLHNDVSHAQRQIARQGPGVIVVDAVYSTNGSLCPVHDFAALAKASGCALVVDESHSLGTHGPNGAGVVVGCGLSSQVHFRTASLAKTFAARGGLITCPGTFKDYFATESYPAIFSSGLLDHEIAWFDAVIEFVKRSGRRRQRLVEVTTTIRGALSDLGFDVSSGTEQIIALEPGSELLTLELRDALQSMGIFGSVFAHPATSLHRSIVRLSLNSGLGDGEVASIIDGCARIRQVISLDQWRNRSRKSV